MVFDLEVREGPAGWPEVGACVASCLLSVRSGAARPGGGGRAAGRDGVSRLSES